MAMKRKITTCQYAYEVTTLIAHHIRKKFKDVKVVTYSPMGLGATCAVSVKDVSDKLIGFLTIGYGQNDSFVYQTNETTNTYPKGSIGDLNGFNVVTKPLPTNIDDVIALVMDMSE